MREEVVEGLGWTRSHSASRRVSSFRRYVDHGSWTSTTTSTSLFSFSHPPLPNLMRDLARFIRMHALSVLLCSSQLAKWPCEPR